MEPISKLAFAGCHSCGLVEKALVHLGQNVSVAIQIFMEKLDLSFLVEINLYAVIIDRGNLDK